MPVIDGEKYACSSCIKGHRVSGCTHHDRELHHINPKGRPVKQCEHCRGARKSKSHHAKCDCGEKKDKDKLKDKGDAKVNANNCACHSGAKCICGVKKEPIDLKLDTTRLSLHAARAKPKLMSTQSESTLTIFANGHHKPCHRNNITAHVSGAPYKIGRPHTLHGSAAFASFAQINCPTTSEASNQRSMDTLSLSNTAFHTMFGSTPRSADSLPMTPLSANLGPSVFQEPLFSCQSTAYSQDNNSPIDSQLNDAMASQQWPWASAITPTSNTFGYGSLSTSPSQDCLPNLDTEWPIPSAGLTNPLWSAGDLPLDPSKLNDSLAQPISHSGESNPQSSAGLTTASSSHSDSGEPALFGDVDIKNPQSNESLFWEDNPVFRFATPGASEVLPASTSASASAYVDATSFTKQTNAISIPMTSSDSGDKNSFYPADYSDVSAISIPNGISGVPLTDDWMSVNPDNFDLSFAENWL